MAWALAMAWAIVPRGTLPRLDAASTAAVYGVGQGEACTFGEVRRSSGQGQGKGQGKGQGDMRRYASIFADMRRYAPICADQGEGAGEGAGQAETRSAKIGEDRRRSAHCDTGSGPGPGWCHIH